jgi:hypothetical protein
MPKKRRKKRVGWGLVPKERRSELEGRVLKVLVQRAAGTDPWVGMAELYEAVFEQPCEHAINDSRELRHLVTRMRRDGVPIISSDHAERGGYRLAQGPDDLEAFCRRFRQRGLASLAIEAALRRRSLPELLGQLALEEREKAIQ